MREYLQLLDKVYHEGISGDDRTGVGAASIFGDLRRYDLLEGFPLVTTKEVSFDNIAKELLFFIQGKTNNNDLKEQGVNIWNAWAAKDGDLGPIYGAQWRRWKDTRVLSATDPIPVGAEIIGSLQDGRLVVEREIDQLQYAIDTLKTAPHSRRLVVTAWNPSYLPEEDKSHAENVANGNAVLPACHTLFQFHTQTATLRERFLWLKHLHPDVFAECDPSFPQRAVATMRGERVDTISAKMDKIGIPTTKLSCMMVARSQDLFLGQPYNIASYSLLLMMVAQVVNMIPGDYVHVSGNAHIYSNHREQVVTQLNRQPYSLPKVTLNPNIKNIDDFTIDDIQLTGYECHEAIRGKVAV